MWDGYICCSYPVAKIWSHNLSWTSRAENPRGREWWFQPFFRSRFRVHLLLFKEGLIRVVCWRCWRRKHGFRCSGSSASWFLHPRLNLISDATPNSWSYLLTTIQWLDVHVPFQPSIPLVVKLMCPSLWFDRSTSLLCTVKYQLYHLLVTLEYRYRCSLVEMEDSGEMCKVFPPLLDSFSLFKLAVCIGAGKKKPLGSKRLPP